MALASPEQVRDLLLGGSVPRFLQDSPILPDVWSHFARTPDDLGDLLLTAHEHGSAFAMAAEVRERVNRGRPESAPASVAPLARVAAARVDLEELLAVLLPMTTWWRKLKVTEVIKGRIPRRQLIAAVQALRNREILDVIDPNQKIPRDLVWLISVAGAFVAAARDRKSKSKRRGKATSAAWPPSPKASVNAFLDAVFEPARTRADADLETTNTAARKDVAPPKTNVDREIWRIALNRTAHPATAKSVMAIKADAAQTLFKIKCDHLTWAVLDCGIDATHPAFILPDGTKRVVRTLDFSQVRDLLDPAKLQAMLKEMQQGPNQGGAVGSHAKEIYDRLLAYLNLQRPKSATAATFNDVAQFMISTRRRLEAGLTVDMGILEPFLDVQNPEKPKMGHGTHVAGIIGAAWLDAAGEPIVQGVCPDIKIMDMRVLQHDDPDGSGSEFAVIAAAQFIRYLNDHSNTRVVHGANLSLYTPHDVRNNACGATPICEACDELVASGVMVVAAAGNGGLRVDTQADGRELVGYLAISITDPGNADRVLTVGSAHRERPHQYGVSYFSSRGPTGDGRYKPDLVAPGERIESTLPGPGLGPRDGTSQAAAHVSGAAALLMGRYPELVGKPDRIKRILCESATDLGRDRYFQGAGMIDVLRALQSI